MDNDKQQLKLLSIFHYIVGGITALFSCIPLIHVTLGIAMLCGALDGQDASEAPPHFLGWIFILFPSLIVLCGWALSVCMVIAGKKLSRFNSWMFCIVIAGLECLLMPFGTVLGVFTIIVLMREPVKELFQQSSPL